MDESLRDRKNPTREQPHAVDPVAFDSAVLCEQVRILYESPAVLLVNLIIAVFVAYLLRDFYPGWLVVAWVGLFVVMSAQIYDSWCYRRKPQPAETAPSWALHFTVGTTATGCLWGLIVSILLLTSDLAHVTFVAFVVGGMTAGAAISNSAFLPAMIGFAAPTMLPAILVLFTRANLMSMTMGLMVAAFAAELWLLSHRTNHWITSIARREIIQAALTADLKNKVAAIEYRSELLHSVSLAASNLITASTLEEAMPKVLEIIGKAVRVGHVLVLELQHSAGTEPILSLRCGWHSANAPVMFDSDFFANAAQSGLAADPLFAPLSELKAVTGLPRTMTAGAAKTLFESLGISSILVVPMVIDGKYWGQIGFDDCKMEREWNPTEIDTLPTIADMIAGSLIHKQHIEELKDANTIIERSSTILFRLGGGPSLPLIYVSHNVTMFGYDPAEMVASPEFYQTIIHPDDALKILELLARIVAEGSEPAAVEFRMRASDGTYRWLESYYTPIRDAAGRLIEIEGILTDVTESKEAADKIMVLARAMFRQLTVERAGGIEPSDRPALL